MGGSRAGELAPGSPSPTSPAGAVAVSGTSAVISKAISCPPTGKSSPGDSSGISALSLGYGIASVSTRRKSALTICLARTSRSRFSRTSRCRSGGSAAKNSGSIGSSPSSSSASASARATSGAAQ